MTLTTIRKRQQQQRSVMRRRRSKDWLDSEVIELNESRYMSTPCQQHTGQNEDSNKDKGVNEGNPKWKGVVTTITKRISYYDNIKVEKKEQRCSTILALTKSSSNNNNSGKRNDCYA